MHSSSQLLRATELPPLSAFTTGLDWQAFIANFTHVECTHKLFRIPFLSYLIALEMLILRELARFRVRIPLRETLFFVHWHLDKVRMSTDLISRPMNNETSRSPSINNSANTVGLGGQQRRFDEDVNLPLIKVVVLGAPAVGKTSVVKVRKYTNISIK